MPELPEVETIRLGLSKKIVGLTISNVQVLHPRTFQSAAKALKLRGYKVLRVWRRAKILGINLGMSNAGLTKQSSSRSHPFSSSLFSGTLAGEKDARTTYTLLFHLKMTGQIIVIPAQAGIQENKKQWVRDQGFGELSRTVRDDKKRSILIGGHPTPDMRDTMPNKSTRVIFEFSDGSKLYFNDQRKFGWIKLINSSSLMVNGSLKDLGPEPLEKGFTWQVLKTNLLRHKNLAVKVALMDQKVVSGVGNIYANETCFDAKIDPRTKVSGLTDTHFRALHQGVIKSLKDAIKSGGSTIAHFVDSEGHKGYFLDYAYVYGRDGEKCKKCGSIIQKLRLAGRGTYFCKKCQKS